MECTADSEPDNSALPARSGTDKFTTRSQDVFSGLGDLEKKHSAFLKVLSSKGTMEDQGLVKMDPEDEDSPSESRNKSRQPSAHSAPYPHGRARPGLRDTRGADYRRSPSPRQVRHGNKTQSGRSSFQDPSFKFKQPQRRPPHRRGQNQIPDFKKHPDKYTHYSLGDVSEKDMSERSNSRAALAFLEERRLQREKEEQMIAGVSDEEEIIFDTELAACSQGRIAFSRPNQKRGTDDKHDKGNKAQSMGETESSLFSNFEDGNSLEEGEEGKSTKTGTAGEEDIQNLPGFKSRKTKGIKRNIRKKCVDEDEDGE